MHPVGPFPGQTAKPGLFFRLAIGFLFFANVVDMKGGLGLKYAAFVAMVPWIFKGLQRMNFSTSEVAFGFYLFVFWPCFALANGINNGASLREAISQTTPLFLGFPMALLLRNVDLRFVMRSMLWMVAVMGIFVMAVNIVLLFMPGDERIFQFLDKLSSYNDRFVGERDASVGLVPKLYMAATLWLVPAFIYFAFMGNIPVAAVCFVALAVSISKAGTLIALFAAVAMVLARSKRKWLIVLASALGVAAALYFVPRLPQELQLTLLGHSGSARMRILHLQSYIDFFDESPLAIIIGQGSGAEFFTVGEGDYVARTEVDHIDAIRRNGLPWFLAYTLPVLLSAWKLAKTKDRELKAIGFSIGGMYVASGTNPHLVSPLFTILFFIGYGLVAWRRSRANLPASNASAAFHPHRRLAPAVQTRSA